jgi:vitamin B12/bleomycin/antimicrobial peptide transport system ATP-binding/permease protein
VSGSAPREGAQSLGAVLRDAWRLTKPYFNSEERWSARLLLLAVVVLNLSLVGINVVLNFWNGAFFDTLQNKDGAGFAALLLTWRPGVPSLRLSDPASFMPGFVMIAVVYIAVAIYATYLLQGLQMNWRRWLTERLLESWLSDRAYYTIGLQSAGEQSGARPEDASGRRVGTDNPDQRIAEDCRSFTADTLRLGVSLMRNVITLLSFAQILWTLSGVITLFGVLVPGYLLLVAIVYAVVGTWLTHLVGRPLARIEFEKQRYEADFRYALVRVRENVEGVALYGGEALERGSLLDRFSFVVMNWRQYMSRTKKVNALVAGYEQVASIFPLAVASPRYFSGEIALGALTRISGAFSRVQGALSWFLEAYQDLAVWKATVDRLSGFDRAVTAARGLASGGVRVREEGAGEGAGELALDDVRLALPDGRVLLEGASMRFVPGESTVVTGRSGSGKSTLFRAIAGIWPFGTGTVRRPRGRVLFLPQRPYLPLGTLRRAVTYPADPASVPDAAVREALAAAGLGALAGELDAEQSWAQRLSGGEQQRLALARALLLKPDWLFLDEATASLDPEAEAELYQMLRERLPGTTIVSIAHRAEVARWHERRLALRDGGLRAA